jgi:CheY-like chemotaxis protein
LASRQGLESARHLGSLRPLNTVATRRRAVLIVDGDPGTVELCRNVLETSGFPCFASDNAEAALASVHLPNVGVVVLDLDIPQDGVSLAWRLQTLPTPPRVIALSASSHAQVHASPFTAVLLRPVEPEALITAVDAALSGT